MVAGVASPSRRERGNASVFKRERGRGKLKKNAGERELKPGKMGEDLLEIFQQK